MPSSKILKCTIWNRIDENADGIVSQDELAKWIKFTQTRFDQRSQIEWHIQI